MEPISVSFGITSFDLQIVFDAAFPQMVRSAPGISAF